MLIWVDGDASGVPGSGEIVSADANAGAAAARPAAAVVAISSARARASSGRAGRLCDGTSDAAPCRLRGDLVMWRSLRDLSWFPVSPGTNSPSLSCPGKIQERRIAT